MNQTDEISQPSIDPVPFPEPRVRQRQAGWLLCTVASGTIFLLAFVPSQLGSSASILAAASILLTLIALLVLMVGVGLLIWGYLDFIRTIRGMLLWVAVFMMGLGISALAPDGNANPFSSSLVLVATTWGLVAALAIGPALVIYLLRIDQSVAIFAMTYLTLVLALFSIGQIVGWDRFLIRLVGGSAGQQGLWLLQGLLCITMWVTLVCPLAFVWHTVVLARREIHSNVRVEE